MSELAALSRDLRKIPNLLTLSRIVLVFVAAYINLRVHAAAGLALGIFAGLTDVFDGIVARKLKQVSRLGEVLDQFSDLVFESFVLYLAGFYGYPPELLVAYLFREFWVVTMRRFMAEYQINIESSSLGKRKTNLIMGSCVPAFASFSGVAPSLDPYANYLGLFGMSLGIFLGYLAAIDYTRQFVRGYNRVCR